MSNALSTPLAAHVGQLEILLDLYNSGKMVRDLREELGKQAELMLVDVRP